jgi:hypothetical protein
MLNAGSQNFKKLGYLGERIAPDGIGIKDTIYYSVPDFMGIDQSGDTLHSNDLSNNVFVVFVVEPKLKVSFSSYTDVSFSDEKKSGCTCVEYGCIC